MSRIALGSEIRYFRWATSAHVVHRALVRNITGVVEGHPDVDLSFWNLSPTNRNAIPNFESLATTTGFNYWRHAFNVEPEFNHSRPILNTVPDAGDCIWYARWDATLGEHHFHQAIVTNVGAGGRPQLSLFYITAASTRQLVTAVQANLTLTPPIEQDWWTRRRLVREIPE